MAAKTATSEKIDLFKELKAEYATPKKPILVETTPGVYLGVEGRGAPGGESFQTAIGALYGMAYTAKFTSKQRGRDYKVAPLEGIWWGARRAPSNPHGFFDDANRERWHWRLLIRTPTFVDQALRDEAVDALLAKGKGAEVRSVKLIDLHEGLAVQMLHVGPYDEEPCTLEAMAAFQREKGLKPHGLHHEIYLSDPRRVPPERLRTILRLPVAKR